jgi:sensor histidine kinase regulating citrate/malate metabolism
VIAAFYVLFLAAYHMQMQKRMQAELLSSMLNAEIKQAAIEAEALRHAAAQTAVYQHDMRHHLTAIDGFLTANKPQQATEYIRKVQADVEAITPKRFCENELVNLLCSAFFDKAQKLGIQLTVNVRVPKDLSIPDTALCSLLSNGLENALHAAATLDEPLRWVTLYCEHKLNKLLIEIKNPYKGTIVLENGLPATLEEGHGYGCRSILAITQHHRGLCSFEPCGELFTLRIILPL